jgi:para-aminobenzoate synthetase component 1
MTFEDLNKFGKERKPFLFICDFKAQKMEAFTLKSLLDEDIEFCIDKNYHYKSHSYTFSTNPISLYEYKYKFDKIIDKIKAGETYLTNLTQATPIKLKHTLKQMYTVANAAYKLRFKDEFICFSPEQFIEIKENKIHTFPMKGTINANVKNAREKILADKKELAEHIMVVDLLRNDLSMVAKDVKVNKFRYLTEIEAGEKKLLQVSSHISGNIGEDWHDNIGTILQTLLPAGSISGAPKKSTLEIIESVEKYDRGFFSGVFGVYDGSKLDSGVMIRYIEKTEKGFVYKSGGGITLDSDAMSEYQELHDKIYLP